jgi:tetratricopeptide (TPR) repeat protein
MTNGPTAAAEGARQLLREALALHQSERIDDALAAADQAVALDPALASAYAYIGNTLVTRKRAFAEGIAALQKAADLAPQDPGIWFTLGWCQEYAANALGKPKGRSRHREDTRRLDAASLYEASKQTMLHARTLNPEPSLLGDIEDILDVIAKETGVPWDDEEDTDAASAAG